MRSTETMNRMLHIATGWCLLLVMLLGTGCVHMQAPAYQAGVDNTARLLQGSGTVAVEPFTAAPGVKDRGLSVRGSPLDGAADGRFSTYLGEALSAELGAAHRLDPKSQVRIRGVLTRNELNGAGVSVGKARVGARFTVVRDGQQVYDKELDATHEWESSFIGMVAIPAAVQNYVTTVQKLLSKLISDDEFARATASP